MKSIKYLIFSLCVFQLANERVNKIIIQMLKHESFLRFRVLHLDITFAANLEECFKTYESIIHGSEQSLVGLELVGTMDGCQTMGGSWHCRKRAK